MPLEIDDDRSVRDRPARRGRSTLRAAEEGAHARDELVGAERLGEVIVGAELESHDSIRFFRAGRQHDDRQRGGRVVSTNRATDFEAVHLREHEIEDEQIRRPRGDRRERLAPRRHDLRRETGLPEIARDELSDVRVVFDDEDASGHRESF